MKDNGRGCMDSDFDSVFDSHQDMIPYFDFNNFTRKHIISTKAQHVLACAIFSIIVQNIKVKFDMSTRRKKSNFWLSSRSTCSKFSFIYPYGCVRSTYFISKVSYNPQILPYDSIISY